MSSDAPSSPYRVYLIGCGPTSLSALEALGEGFRVVGLARECPADDGHDPVAALARRLGIPVHPRPTLRSLERQIGELEPDCVVVSSYDRVLPEAILGRRRFVNVHYSPLPRYRGRANVNWAVINGERAAGITIHTIVPGLDAGNILFQQLIPIHDDQTVADLYLELNRIQRERLGAAVRAYIEGDPGAEQREAEATYCCSRNPEDGEIDWSRSARQIHDLIRALAPPFPGAFTHLDGRRLAVWKAECLEPAPAYVGRVPGRVVAVSRMDGFVDVLAGEGVVRLHEVQRVEGAREPAATVIGSVRETLGLRTSDLLSRIERLERILRELGHPAP
ncbi:MAG: methionyl-tRNA formyltransferase [Isosphaeraceae bacterium]